jgi:hypothetical protein
MENPLPSDKFEIREGVGKFDKIICKKCRQVWAWPAEKDLSAGAILELLNHYAQHEQE